ncbi:MAG TPA: UGSC family (seleno)protein, partial [Acidimicrobiales bacterium]
LDSVNLEKLGIPTVTVVTVPFEPAARAVARSQGLPELPLVVVPHDYLEEDDARIRAKLEPVVEQFLVGLFGVAG